MAKVKFELLYVLEDELGKDEVEIEVDGHHSIREVLKELLSKSEKSYSSVFDGEVFRHDRIVLKNGIDINNLQGPDTTMCNDDTIRVMPSEAGG